MSIKVTFQSLVGKIASLKKGGEISHTERVARHWLIFLIAFFVFILMLLTWGFFTFREISRGDFYVSKKKSEVTKETIDIKKTDKVISVFQIKTEKFNELLKNSASAIDPSR